MDTAVAADPRAAHLLGLWSRLSAQHVTLGSGCGCGVGGVSVSLQDFELDIADYLWAEGERLGQGDVVAFLLVLVRQDSPRSVQSMVWSQVVDNGLAKRTPAPAGVLSSIYDTKREVAFLYLEYNVRSFGCTGRRQE